MHAAAMVAETLHGWFTMLFFDIVCWRWVATIPYYFSNLHGGAEILVHVATCFVLIPTQEKLMLHLLRLTNINIIFPSETAHSNRGWRWVATLWYSSL